MGLANDILQMNIGQIFQTPTLPAADFAGQTIVVTGANTGLGFEAAKHFYSRKAAVVILACRDMAKGERAREAIIASGSAKRVGKVEVWQLDMSKYSSVLAFADRLNSLTRVDALLANAGIDRTEWETFEGHESTLTVNVISTLLLAMAVLPKLRQTSSAQKAPSHLVFTGSVMHIFAKDKYLRDPSDGEIFRALNEKATADMDDRYNLSKLLLLMATHKLADKLSLESGNGQASIIVNCVNPGWCRTELFRARDGGLGGRIGLRLIGRSAEEGSRTLVHAATCGQESHGKYLSECRVKSESEFMRSDLGVSTEKRVWTELLLKLENIRSGVTM